MQATAIQIANATGGLVDGIVGDEARIAFRVSAFDNSKRGSLSFATAKVQIVDEVREDMIIFCIDGHVSSLRSDSVTLLITGNPRLSFMRAVTNFFAPSRPAAGVHPTAVVSPTARLHPTCTVSAHCVIGSNCEIGERSIVYPNVTLYSDVTLGCDVIVHSGTVIGADGFGYQRNENGYLEKFLHLGGVVIEDDVEIGSNTSIDRGTLSDTIVRRGVRIDNHCHISHNVIIGRNTAVIAQSMIGGSVQVGDNCWVAPGAVVLNKVKIGARAIIGIGAVVMRDVHSGETVMGAPAVPAKEFQATRAAIKSLRGGTG
jgi:UDP-3-O-[3-hydroxymyristoyl] glucosamine N-acyltransferase